MSRCWAKLRPDPRFAEALEALVPMRRFGQPAEAGALIEFLVSGRCNFLSGQVLGFSGAGA
jgi:NAD(P)-dependent dehydrogenase (short-subunit alcohol dehydrogenase family)